MVGFGGKSRSRLGSIREIFSPSMSSSTSLVISRSSVYSYGQMAGAESVTIRNGRLRF